MPSGAGQLSSGGGGQGCGAGAVTRSRPGWPSALRRRDSGEVGPPGGGRRSRGCPDAGQAGRCRVRLVRSPVGASVQQVKRTSSVRVSGVQASDVPASGAAECPDGQAPVSARCRAVRAALDREVVRCGGPLRPGAVGRRGAVVCERRGRLPASGRTGRDGAALAVAGSHEVDRSQGRRWPASGCGALAPAGRQGRWSRARVPAGWRRAWDGVGVHRLWQGVLGRALAWCPTMGLDQGRAPRWVVVGRGWSRRVQLRRIHPVRWGSSLRPQRGRGA
jgi:hypothetical protein